MRFAKLTLTLLFLVQCLGPSFAFTVFGPASGQYEDYDYDTRNRLTDIDLKNSSHTLLLGQEYMFDDASNVVTCSPLAGPNET